MHLPEEANIIKSTDDSCRSPYRLRWYRETPGRIVDHCHRSPGATGRRIDIATRT